MVTPQELWNTGSRKLQQAIMTDWGLKAKQIFQEMGNLRAQVGQAACPTWASSLPQAGRFYAQPLPDILIYWHSCLQNLSGAYNEPYTLASRIRLRLFSSRQTLAPLTCNSSSKTQKYKQALIWEPKPSRQLQTITRPITACISKPYIQKPDGLTVFSIFWVLRQFRW